VKDSPQGFGKERNIFPAAGEAHQPDAPDLALQGSESDGDIDVIGLSEACPDIHIIYPKGHTRASFSQERMTYLDQEGKVVYMSRDGKDTKVFPALELLAVMCFHIPKREEQMVRYYGFGTLSETTVQMVILAPISNRPLCSSR
jgi:chitinase